LTSRAPTFEKIADQLRSFIGDRIVVAHQASFDVSFLKQEYLRLGGQSFDPISLCTLKLARRLAPGLPSHALDALIQVFDLPIRRRHRAMPDALAAVDLLNRLVFDSAIRNVQDWDGLRALAEGPKRKRPVGTYERARLKELPAGPGVYLLKDSDENIFYIGKSVNLRRRVGDHVRGKHEGQPRLRRQVTRLADVEAIPTATELEALLLEARLIKRYLPVANSQLREETHYPFIKIDLQSEYPRLELTRQPVDDGSLYFGPFRSARLVGAVVDYLRGAFGIRECTRTSLPDGKACLLLHLKKCLGPCIGAVTVDEYRGAVDRAIGLLRGEWTEILEGLENRMLGLAEQEQFEEAAELRDLVSQLRTVVSTHQRLSEMNDYHAVILTRFAPDRVQAFFVHAGRLADQTVFSWPEDRRRVGSVLRRVYRAEQPGPITSDGVDEAWILASWIRHRDESDVSAVVEVQPNELPEGLRSVRAALDTLCSNVVPIPASALTTDSPGTGLRSVATAYE